MINRTAPKDVTISLVEKRRVEAIQVQKDRRRLLLQQLREIDSSPDITSTSDTCMETSSSGINEKIAAVLMAEKGDKNEVAAMSDTEMARDKMEEVREKKREREIILGRVHKTNRALKYSNLFMIPE